MIYGLKLTSNAIGIATCMAGLIPGVGTLALIGCGATILGIVADVFDFKIWGVSSTVIGTITGAVGCFSGNLMECTATAAGVGLALKINALEKLENEKIANILVQLQLPGFLSVIPKGTYTISLQMSVVGNYTSQSFTSTNTDISLFAQTILSSFNTATAQMLAVFQGIGGIFTMSSSTTYTPWNGTSFTITFNFSVTMSDLGLGVGSITSSGYIKYTIVKI